MAPHGNSSLASRLVSAALCLAGAAAPAFGQSSQSLGHLFAAADSVEVTPDGARRFMDAAREGRAPGECPRAKFTVIVKSGDPLWQNALAAARRDVLLRLLGDQMRYFLFETNIEGATHEVRVEYDVARDQEFPKLEVVWDPPKGSRVREGTRITARATASDDSNLWQSGVRRIDMEVLSEGNRSFGFHEWPPRPLTCQNTPPARTLEGVYTVPSPAPPIVRLRVLAVDHAGLVHPRTHIAEYPTGDWYGTFETESADGRYRTRADIALNHDRRGNLTGTMVGEQRVDWSGGDRGFQRTLRPNRFRVSLVGTYTEGRSLQVFIKEIEESKLLEERGREDGLRYQFEFGFKTHIWTPEALLGTQSPLGEGEVLADGRQYKLEHPPTKVTLRPARD